MLSVLWRILGEDRDLRAEIVVPDFLAHSKDWWFFMWEIALFSQGCGAILIWSAEQEFRLEWYILFFFERLEWYILLGRKIAFRGDVGYEYVILCKWFSMFGGFNIGAFSLGQLWKFRRECRTQRMWNNSRINVENDLAFRCCNRLTMVWSVGDMLSSEFGS